MIVKGGEVYPWLNETAFDLIEQWKMSEWDVFEYGSGWSTIWWAMRCRNVVSVESDQSFYGYMKTEIEKFHNVDYRFRTMVPCSDCEYVQAINESNGVYDLVIIDGRNRVLCTKEVLTHLKPTSVVIFDNTDRHDYDDGVAVLDEILVGCRGYTKYRTPYFPEQRPGNRWWETTIWTPGEKK